MRKVFALLALLVLIGCSGNDIRVFFYGDMGRPLSLSLEVKRGDDKKVDETFDSPALPASYTLSDGESGGGEKITIEVVAVGTGFNVARVARLDFDPERDIVLSMPLCASCGDVECAEGETCAKGQCVSDRVDEGDLPEDGEDPSQSECGGGGAGGSGGSGGASCTSRCAQNDDCGACPTVAMVPAGGTTIDQTEVTRAAYQAWLATDPQPESVHPNCEGITDFSPSADLEAVACSGDCAQHPQVGITWCAAYQYCDWAGKRLCGVQSFGPADAEWEVACRGETTQAGTTYPYGDAYQASTCNGVDAGVGATWAVGSNTACVNADGAYDLSGNVAEWTNDGCSGASCNYRGGHYGSPQAQLTCSSYFSGSMDVPSETIGFRCCGF